LHLLNVGFKVDTIFIFGNVHVTTPALTTLLDQGIELAFLTMAGRLKGQLTPPKAKNVLLRVAQYQKFQEEPFALNLARCFVQGKMRNAHSLLTRQHRNYPERGFEPYRQELGRLLYRVDQAQTLDTLRGLEGTAARTYSRLSAWRVALNWLSRGAVGGLPLIRLMPSYRSGIR
jgi:CRISP-associated protein Cas1